MRDGESRITRMRFRTRISSFLGFVAAAILALFGKSPAPPTADDLKRADFGTSTQRLGIRFTEKVRDVFRLKWLHVRREAKTRDGARTGQSGESGRIQ